MDLILYGITALIVFNLLRHFAGNFAEARRLILIEKTMSNPVVTFESVTDKFGNPVILVYNYWNKSFIGQGRTGEEVQSMLQQKFNDLTVRVVNQDEVITIPSVRAS